MATEDMPATEFRDLLIDELRDQLQDGVPVEDLAVVLVLVGAAAAMLLDVHGFDVGFPSFRHCANSAANMMAERAAQRELEDRVLH